MDSVAILSTGFALLVLAACVVCMLVAAKHVNRCIELCDELRTSRGRLIANEKSISALNDRIHRIDGQLAYMKRRKSLNGLEESARSAADHLLDLAGETPDDDELAAVLRLQTAPPVAPGKGSA